MVQKVWLVTGCSSGFGEQFIKTILERGDKAIATARKIEAIEPLAKLGASTLQLDVTASQAELDDKVKQAIAFYGHVDVIVHNAGYGQVGAVEDLSSDLMQAQFATNTFGPWHLTKSILPHFRSRGSGHVVLISSVASWMDVPGMSAYSASKAALDRLFASLAQEVGPYGIKVLTLQPGSFNTEVRNPAKVNVAPSEHYGPLIGMYDYFLDQTHGRQPGDPEKLAQLMMDLVKGEGVAEGKEVPVLFPVGPDTFTMVKGRLETEAKTLEVWESAIKGTNYADDREMVTDDAALKALSGK